MEIEQWRPLEAFEDTYSVSSLGKVKRRSTGRILAPYPDASGYPVVKPSQCSVRKSLKVHSLVAKAFLGPRPQGKVVHHVDGNKWNAAASNLMYVSPKENTRLAIKDGLRLARPKPLLSKKEVLKIRTLGKSHKAWKVAKMLDLDYRIVLPVLRGKTYKRVV